MRTRFMLIGAAGLLLTGSILQLGLGPAMSVVEPPSSPQSSTQTVRLIIDYPDGTQVHFTRLPHAKDMSVIDALAAAKALQSPRALSFVTKGSGAMAMVTSIAGVENQGGGKDRRNWQFWVNDQFAKQGAGAITLSAGDRVTWSFAVWSDPPAPRPE